MPKSVPGVRRFGQDIAKGNVAIAVVMAGVILVTSCCLQEGVSSLTKSLIPRPAPGQFRIGP